MDPLAEKFHSVNPYAYTDNSPINNMDPNGMETLYNEDAQNAVRQLQSQNSSQNRNHPPDWFVDNSNGSVYYFRGIKNMTQEILDKFGFGISAKNLENFGPDNMFGNNPKGLYENSLSQSILVIENSKSFMAQNGYSAVENVTVKEQEFVSGGRMDGNENIKTTISEISQIGKTKLTYVLPSLVNLKYDVMEVSSGNNSKLSAFSSASSSSKINYSINKPIGQSIRATAKYYENKQPTASKIGFLLKFISKLF